MRVKVKICGITNLDDAIKAAELGADAIGFVFWEGSRRFISPAAAARILREMPPFMTSVGVFVNEGAKAVNRVIDETGIDCAQLHGEESPEECLQVKSRVIKAIRIKDSKDLRALKSYNVSAFLLDAFIEGVPGGTGKTFDWNIAVEAKSAGRIILSGGLTPENVKEAVKKVGPYAIDVSSGVELAPGKKDHAKLKKFMEQVRKNEKTA